MSADQAPHPAPGTPADGRGADGVTVLVVEDSRVNRLALVRGVEREGYRVVAAADGREALDVLGCQTVDMVLLDLLMPDVDGFAVLAAMGADPSLGDVPVLVISAVETSEDVARAIAMGAIDCLPKPVDPVLLRVRIRTALERSRLRRLERAYLRQELALREQERLATLGRLSAGLGHELNNPAAAALSASRQLRQALAMADTSLADVLSRPRGAEVVASAEQLRARATPPGGDAQRRQLEEALEDTFMALGVAHPWTVAGELAAVGVAPAEVGAVGAELGDEVVAAVDWLRSRARVQRLVDAIVTSVSRMAELTTALRGYSYVDRAPQQDIDVRQGLDHTLTILAHKRPAGVTVVRDDADDLPLIHAYGGQLNQVWTNLLDNALAAVGDAGTVTVRTRRAGAGVVVEVADDGPGIPPELQGRVFEPFVTTKPPGEGTGLGLAITHQIVTEVHGGDISVTSTPGSTSFRVRLPPIPPPRSDDGA
jgi:signal transduction histidine kinase